MMSSERVPSVGVSSRPLCAPTGEPEPGPELGVGHRLPRGEHRSRGPEGGQAAPGPGSAVAGHQDRTVRRHRAQQERRCVCF